MALSTSKRNALASDRRSSKRCSARARSARATRACQAVPTMPGDQRQEHRRRGGDRAAMAAHELRGAIAERVVAGQHRQAGAMAADVLGELVDRGVAPHRLLG